MPTNYGAPSAHILRLVFTNCHQVWHETESQSPKKKVYVDCVL